MERTYLETPIGCLEIIGDEKQVTSIMFIEKEETQDEKCTSKAVLECKVQLHEYFEGKRYVFDVPFQQQGTDFEQNVWNALPRIEYGKTASYKDVAISIGNPAAVRAIGRANSKNKLSIVLPCHRVIGANGKMVGYTGELWRKEWLLEHESKLKN